MASGILSKIIGLFKNNTSEALPLEWKRRNWGNLGPDSGTALAINKRLLFNEYDAFSKMTEEVLQVLKHLFEHTGGTMIADCADELESGILKNYKNAQELARLAWVGMDSALEQARRLAQLTVAENPSQGGDGHE